MMVFVLKDPFGCLHTKRNALGYGKICLWIQNGSYQGRNVNMWLGQNNLILLICCSLQNGTEQMCLISSLEEFWISLHFSFRLCFNSSRPPDIYFSTGLLRSHRTISIRFGSGLDITLIFLLSFIFQQFFLLSCSAWGSFIAALQRGSDSNNLFTCQSGEIKLHKKLHFPQDTYDVCELN